MDWNLEIGAVIRRSYDLRAPAPLFTNITGYQGSGFRVLGAPAALSGHAHPLARIALSLGLPATAAGRQIIEAVVAARGRPGIPLVKVPAESAPCKQNVARGADIDLYRFPTPLIHRDDGGRYIQTYGMNIAAAPDGAWTNWSVNRMMIAGKDRLACLIPPPQHLGNIRAKWAALGRPMPILSALFGEGIEVTTAETVGLPVPATAEIVIEGHIAVDETAMEGPMNEYPGYNATEASPKPVFTVSAVTWRDGAILPVVAAGPPVEEDHTVTGPMHAAELLYQFRRGGLPVASAWVSFESAFHWLIVAVRPDWPDAFGGHSGELARRIGEVTFAGKAGFGVPKILVVEDDIDITSVNEVVWAFATRAHPEHGEVRFPAEPTQVAGEVYLEGTELHSYQAGKVVYNCLLADRFDKKDRPVKGDLEHGWPAEVRQRVLGNWHTYGYRDAAS